MSNEITLQRMAAEIAPQLDEAIKARLGQFSGSAAKLASVLDDNKIGILRVLKHVAAPTPKLDDAALREILAARNPFEWAAPNNIDKHPLRYSPVRDAIEGIILTRLHRNKVDGYVLEMSVQIAEVADLAARVSSPTMRDDVIEECATVIEKAEVAVRKYYWLIGSWFRWVEPAPHREELAAAIRSLKSQQS